MVSTQATSLIHSGPIRSSERHFSNRFRPTLLIRIIIHFPALLRFPRLGLMHIETWFILNAASTAQLIQTTLLRSQIADIHLKWTRNRSATFTIFRIESLDVFRLFNSSSFPHGFCMYVCRIKFASSSSLDKSEFCISMHLSSCHFFLNVNRFNP